MVNGNKSIQQFQKIVIGNSKDSLQEQLIKNLIQAKALCQLYGIFKCFKILLLLLLNLTLLKFLVSNIERL